MAVRSPLNRVHPRSRVCVASTLKINLLGQNDLIINGLTWDWNRPNESDLLSRSDIGDVVFSSLDMKGTARCVLFDRTETREEITLMVSASILAEIWQAASNLVRTVKADANRRGMGGGTGAGLVVCIEGGETYGYRLPATNDVLKAFDVKWRAAISNAVRMKE